MAPGEDYKILISNVYICCNTVHSSMLLANNEIGGMCVFKDSTSACINNYNNRLGIIITH